MSEVPPFVQIAAARIYNQGHVLYALDEDGQVWEKRPGSKWSLVDKTTEEKK